MIPSSSEPPSVSTISLSKAWRPRLLPAVHRQSFGTTRTMAKSKSEAKAKAGTGSRPRVLYWFRTDLRLHDSPALKAALHLDPECLYPVWCWDPHYVYRARVGPNRWQILLDCLNDLSSGLTKLNPNQKLLLIREGPTTLLAKLFKEWNISHLVFEKDTDAYAKDRDSIVRKRAEEAGVEVISPCGRTLYDSDDVVQANGGKPTMSISQLEKAGKKIGKIPRPIDAPSSLPDPGEISLTFTQTRPKAEPDWCTHLRSQPDQSYAKLAGPNDDFAIPTLQELGLPAATTPHKGGETVALAVLDQVFANEDYAATFEKPKTAPTAHDPPDTTVLSHHLHFGSLSVRLFYWRAQDLVDARRKKGKSASQPPTSLTGQLLFRDMYFGAQAALGHAFSQTVGNPSCRFIPWHLPTRTSSVDVDGKREAKDAGSSPRRASSPTPEPEYTVDSAEAERWFQRWRDGTTGFPFVDALMRQLRSEGWIHHLGRHMVACFLTRGGCYVDWQRGAAVFEEWLIDHEACCNAGNWQWLSCSAFYSQFFRCYSPIAFGKKYGEELGAEFIRKYVPELKDVPDRHVWEPSKCPAGDLKRAGVVISGDGSEAGTEQGGRMVYPKPMFDFGKRRDVCMAAMKKAYSVGLYGNDERVLDGTWRALFNDDDEGPTKGASGSPGAMVEVKDEGEGESEENGDDADADEANASGKGKKKAGKETHARASKSVGSARGRKRGTGDTQGTLDGLVKRTKK